MKLSDPKNMPWAEIVLATAIIAILIVGIIAISNVINSEGYILMEDGETIPFESYIFTSDSCVRIDTGETICGTFRIIEKD